MWSEIKPDRRRIVEVAGYRVAVLHHPGAIKILPLENTVADLPGIKVPCLITAGQHDELTPAGA